ncbi:MAG: intermembrane transport protein PqiB [Rhodopila sp.]
MNDEAPKTNDPKANDEAPKAVERHSRWPGWIWSVPIAALAIVGYLVFQQFAQRGPSVTVIFPTADIKADDTKVKFEGYEVGQVEKVSFENDLRHVKTVLRLHPDMAGHLGPGTRFWIAGQKPSLNNLSALKSIISGPFIGIEPHPGKQQDQYQGLAERPVIANGAEGTHYVLRATKLGNIGRGSLVYYRDLEVGDVEGAQLEDDRIHFHIDMLIKKPFDRLVHADTRFWQAGAVQVSMANGGPRLQMQSVPALFEGAVGFETPDEAASGDIAKPDTVFHLFDSRDTAEHAPGKRTVQYQVVFNAQDAGGLESGAPVMLEDKRVGTVTSSQLQYNPETSKLNVAATLALDPTDIDLAGQTKWQDDPKPQMDALMRRLVDQGLRARLGSKIPLVGGKSVQLAFISSAAPADLGSGSVPEIPAGPASDISGIMTTVSSVAGKIDAMPIDQIATEVHDVTQRLATLSKSPEMAQSLERLDRSVENIEHVTHEADVQVGPLLTELRRTATQAESTAAAARGLVSNNPLAQNAPGTGNLGDTLYELNRAARSLRELADYLDRHPEALLHGRG